MDSLQNEVAKLVHQNGLLPVLCALVKVCDEDAIRVNGNLGALIFAAKLEDIVRMGKEILEKHETRVS